MSAKHPIEMLQGLVSVGTPVKIKPPCYDAGQFATVYERLTGKDEPALITGCCRYALRMSDGRIRDYARHEFAKAHAFGGKNSHQQTLPLTSTHGAPHVP